jgi:hypothetical protein
MSFSSRRIVLGIVPTVVAFLGTVLEFALGQSFIATFSSFHQENAQIILVALALLMLFPAFTSVQMEIASHESKLSIHARWLISLPFILSIFVLAAVLAVYGWSAALGRVVGLSALNVPMTIKTYSVRPPSTMRAKHCLRVAELEYQFGEAKVCLDRAYSSSPLTIGQRVLVNGKTSVFGFHVEKVETGEK